MTLREFLRSGVALLGLSALRGSQDPNSENQTTLRVGGSEIEVTFLRDGFDLPAASLIAWVTRAAKAVTAYYGAFPVSRMRVRIESSASHSGVFHGTTWGGNPPFTRIFLGRHSAQAELDDDWMMTHELVHTAFPDVADEHHWIEEGIATYVEPIARVQAGDLAPEAIWADMVRGMPKGQPEAGDSGLDRTHTWGRTYWGGALFCLMADVRIRRATGNRIGLQDALRGIQRAGGTISVDWTLSKAFGIGDQAAQTDVLLSMYTEMKDTPVTVDLASLWRNLGVSLLTAGNAALNDSAPWAATRLAITNPPKA